ncbi:MAG: hypothetical protein QF437_00580 [Planctomycetota bacterium]|jgi:type II secretory pathway pseudopilin PulG|nr:hypothetical protein [Planctomycetota bacterium]MDP7248017.1 hypothetical protein [Planctomycetota bacterium]
MRNILLSLEVILVMGLVAGMSAMGYFNLTGARRAKNEMYARQLLSTLHKAQQAFKNEVQSDRDKNEKAEFGTLAELLGLKESFSYRKFEIFDIDVPAPHISMMGEFRRSLDLPMEEQEEIVIDPNAKPKKKKKERTGDPKWLYESPAYSREPYNRLIFDGYAYRVFLPQIGADRKDMTEEEKMKMVVADVEQYWCAYAWPIKHGSSGEFAYFIDFNGKLYESTDPAISEHLEPKIGAIDAYKGREFTSPVNDTTWAPYVPPKPPAPPKKEGDANADANADQPGDANADANVDKPQKPKETPEEIKTRKYKEKKEEEERRKKLIEESEVDIDID